MQQAIVIRSWLPERQQLMLFEQIHGRCTGFVQSSKTLWSPPQGSLIHYHERRWKGRSIMQSPELVALPAAPWSQDLYFIHLLSELMLQCLPEGDSAPELFQLCLMLYTPIEIAGEEELVVKLLFLCKFFALLGIYPPEWCYHKSQGIQRLLREPATLFREPPAADLVAESIAWLLGCVEAFPHVSLGKTLLMHIIRERNHNEQNNDDVTKLRVAC